MDFPIKNGDFHIVILVHQGVSKMMMYAPKVSSFFFDGLYFPSLRHWLSHEQWQVWAPCEARNMGSKVQLHLTSVCPENRAMRALEAGVEPKCCGGKMCFDLIISTGQCP